MTEDKKIVVMQVLPRLETGGVERGTIEIAAALTAAGLGRNGTHHPARLFEKLFHHAPQRVETG